MAMDACYDARSAGISEVGRRAGGCVSGDKRAEVLLRLVDAGLIAAVFLVPMLLGGRIALGQLVLVATSLWAAAFWCLRQSLFSEGFWVRSPAHPIVLAALVLVGLQLAALPPWAERTLSPKVCEVLPLWASEGSSCGAIGVWNTLSLTPAATRDGLIILLAFALLFLVTVQRVHRVEDAESLIRWIAFSTIAMAALALLQYFADNGKYFWFFEHPFANPSDSLKGSFTNRNHFAQFIALGIGPLIWWVKDGVERNLRGQQACHARLGRNSSGYDMAIGLRVLVLAVVVFAGLLSVSRGGTAAIFVAGLVSVVVLYRGSLLGGKEVLALLGVGLLVGACLCVYGYEMVANRLDDYRSVEELDKHGLRRRIWQTEIAGITDYPVVGTGLGSHCEVLPMYLPGKDQFDAIEVTHAENGYLQIALETGTIGLLLALSAVGLCTYWCLACILRPVPRRVHLCFAAIAAGLAASFLHSLVDFVWYVPGCMVAVVILAACACRLWQQTGCERGDRTVFARVPRAGWLAALAFVAIIGYSMLQNRCRAVRAEAFWHDYLFLSRRTTELEETRDRKTLRTLAEKLSGVVKHQPDHARAHARLTAIHLRLFDRQEGPNVSAIDVKQVREAVLASRFESVEAMAAWLTRAFGRRCEHLYKALGHARRAVRLCPLQGEAYLYLAEVAFLEGHNRLKKGAYTDQALKVRPTDGAVLFAVGQEAVLANDFDKAITCWQASFQAGRAHQWKLLKHLAGQVPVAFLLRTFEPDLQALKYMRRLYRQRGLTNELHPVLKLLAEEYEKEARSLKGEAAANDWVQAAGIQSKLGNLAESLRCLRNALICDLSYYEGRFAMGKCLYQMNRHDEAEKHFSWCLRHKPRDDKVRALLEELVDRRLRMTARPTCPTGDSVR